ncbi:dual oxidase 2-like [Babylonia areolata]|uniref:dual oxidase 2-like n=1 Tax=Babylonia areolata TaxID=304850 RepID=UPI003FCF39AF
MGVDRMAWCRHTPLFFVIALCLTGTGETDAQGTYQRYDGYFNNLLVSDWGSAGRPVARTVGTAYEDETYMPSGWDRPNPRMISNELFQKLVNVTLWPRASNKTAFFAFFGQLVMREVSDTDDSTCPVEILHVSVPSGDPDFDPDFRGDRTMPYQRVAYDKSTGQSPNNPRRQLNKASSYIDGSFVYGSSVVRTAYMREEGTGKLACSDSWGAFPLMNDVRLPFKAYPTHRGKILNPETLWRLGDTHTFENPWLLSLNLLFYRYHNKLVDDATEAHPDWTSDQLFEHARRWVIATLQKVIMYDWLPLLVNQKVDDYTGYNPQVSSEVTDLFDAAAINYILTLLPSVVHKIDMHCQYVRPDRLCHTYWDAKEIVRESQQGTADILRGMTAQLAEEDDMFVVEDVRSKFYGPLFFSRHDAVVLTIMKGRDYGLPDYNTARRELGLPVLNDFDDFLRENPALNATADGRQHVEKMRRVHKNRLDRVDIFVGGMMETTPQGPGPLFTRILLNQMYRIRDGDRFWFENTKNGLFTDEERATIRGTTLSMVLSNVSKEMNPMMKDLPDDVFNLHHDHPCQPAVHLNSSTFEDCPSHQGFDFFAGSEVPFIIIWTCLGLLPLLVILCAYVFTKCRRWQYDRQRREARAEKEKRCALRRSLSCSFHVAEGKEWRGKESPRQVEVHLTNNGTLELFTAMGSQLRTIKLSAMSVLNVKLGANKKRNTVLVQVPQEYDLVVMLLNEEERNIFMDKLHDLVNLYEHMDLVVFELRETDLFSMAITREKRNAMLEKFFKTVFKEAFQMDYDPALDNSQLDMKKQSKEILEVELSKEEFAEAIGVKANSDFVEHFFSLIDSDGNGYISFREFLNAVVLFSKGSCQDKLQTMFYMYDTDGTGVMSKTAIGQMFRSLLELAHSKPEHDEMQRLVDSLVQQAGLQHKEEFTFDDFCQILAPQMDKLWNASIVFPGISKVTQQAPSKQAKTNKKSDTGEMRHRSPSAIGMTMDGSGGQRTGGRLLFEAVRERYSPVKARIKLVKHFIENYRQHIFFLIIFYGIVFFLFAERFYYYTVEREHSGLRLLMSYGISMTRGAAAAMSFSFSFLLLTMCRNSITYLRSTVANLFIPFDSHVSFHKLVAWTALFFTAIHVLGYAFNFYHLVTQPTSFLCIFESIVFRAEVIPTFQWWVFGTMTGFTGVLLVVVLVILYVFATQTARRYIFSLFWMTHKLFIVMYVLTLVHGASVLVQKPLFFAYFIGPAALYMLDKLVSLSRKKTQLSIIKAQNLPSDVTMLEFKRPPRFEYKSGMWVRIACLSQGKDEYHPFTLTSAPHEDTLKVHIRALGPWTWNIRETFDPDNLGPLVRYPKLYLDGPYGAGQQDWYQYEVSVLVGAGIGVTPYASILKDFVHMTSINCTYKVKCQKLYFIWITGSQRHFEWLIDILREVEGIDKNGMVDIDIFITQFFQNFDLRTALLYIFEEHFQKMTGGVSVFTGLKATTHFGRPQMNKIMTAVHKAHPCVKKVGVFSCGPRGVTKGVERACVDASKTTKAQFEHHYENF